MKLAKILVAVCFCAILVGCGARQVSSLTGTGQNQKSAWIGDMDAIMSDIYELATPYGTVVPINHHANKGFIVQSRSFPQGFKTYTMVVVLLSTQGKNANGEAVKAYGVNITCENCDFISSGTEDDLLGEITSCLNGKYQKASF